MILFEASDARRRIAASLNLGVAAEGDGSAGNALLHAYANCVFAHRCGVALAEEFWNDYEEHGENCCQNASMDFHNNDVGRRLAPFAETVGYPAHLNPLQTDDCETLVRQAFLNGELRFLETLPAAKFKDGCGNCRAYISKLEE